MNLRPAILGHWYWITSCWSKQECQNASDKGHRLGNFANTTRETSFNGSLTCTCAWTL